MALLRALLERDPRDRPSIKHARETFDWLKNDRSLRLKQGFQQNPTTSLIQEESKVGPDNHARRNVLKINSSLRQIQNESPIVSNYTAQAKPTAK